MDCEEDECCPEDWSGRSKDDQKYTHFLEDEKNKRTLIFITELIDENGHSTVISNNDVVMFLKSNLDKLFGDRFHAVHTAFDKHCIGLLWDDDKRIYHPSF